MKISTIADLLGATVLCGEDLLENEVHSACGSDMMSDVLAFVKDQAVLLTGLVNLQVVRTAVMMARKGDIILVAGKGHETYQIVGREKRHFDDREELRAAFAELGR